jgi:hypothetical protein
MKNLNLKRMKYGLWLVHNCTKSHSRQFSLEGNR